MRGTRTLAMVGVFALTAIIAVSIPAAAGPIVDPDILTPVPPPGAVCRADGAWTNLSHGVPGGVRERARLRPAVRHGLRDQV